MRHKTLIGLMVIALAGLGAGVSMGVGVEQTPANPASSTAAALSAVGAKAELKATTGNGVSGTLSLASVANGVRITGSIAGLEPNTTHGFHVHEKGDCSAPDASSAGGHFNPSSQPHGNPATMERHAGDMANVVSDAAGNAKLDVVATGVTLRTGQANDIIGKAIVVHQKADDYKTQPSGDSGSRIACGIIK
jgi:Cu-Zn family superoxide dismutase